MSGACVGSEKEKIDSAVCPKSECFSVCPSGGKLFSSGSNSLSAAAQNVSRSTRDPATNLLVSQSAKVARASPRGHRQPTGANVFDCLSTSDLDSLLAPLLGHRYVSSLCLWNYLQNPARRSSDLFGLIRDHLHKADFVFAPLLTHNHWLSALFFRSKGGPNSVSLVVFDSAPSPITANVVSKLAFELNVNLLGIVAWSRQPRDSTECGVHVVMFAMICAVGGFPFLARERPPVERRCALEEGSVDHLRQPLSGLLNSGIPLLVAKKLLSSVTIPKVRILCRQLGIVPPSGGALPTGLPNRDGEAVCFINSVLQAHGVPQLQQEIIQRARSELGLNLRRKDGSRYHEDPLAVIEAFADKITNGLPIQVSRRYDREGCSCNVQNTEDCSFLRFPPCDGLSWQSELDPAPCSRCQQKSRCQITESVVASAGNELRFGIERALYDGTVNRSSHPLPATVRWKGVTFHAVGVVCWAGDNSANFGHYVAYRRVPGDPNWVYCNDSNVRFDQGPFDDSRRTYVSKNWVYAVYRSDVPSHPTRRSRQADHVNASAPASVPAVDRVSQPPQANIRVPPRRSMPDPPVPPITPLTFGHVRSMVALQKVGTLLDVRWSIGRTMSRWIGQLVSAENNSSERFDVVYSLSFCDACGEWHSLPGGGPLRFPIPNSGHPGVVYHAIQVISTRPKSSDPCVGEECDEEAEPDDSTVELPISLAADPVDDRECLGPQIPSVSTLALRGNALASAFIFAGKPPHVHNLVWNALSPATRKEHILWLSRIKALPEDLRGKPLSTAVIELVLRFSKHRNWSASTFASRLSSVASALRCLNLYTSLPQGIDLYLDQTFCHAVKRAQHRAKTETKSANLSTPLEFQQFQQIAQGLKTTPRSWLFAQLLWYFAARPAEVRQLQPADIRVGEAHDDGFHVTLTFRFGKGVAFGGPYTIHAILPRGTAKRLLDAKRRVNQEQQNHSLFSGPDQARVAASVKSFKGCTLRSFRRGALLHLASRGVGDSDLMLLSGHKQKSTLLRYLGWGVESASARAAAFTRHAAASAPSGGRPLHAPPPTKSRSGEGCGAGGIRGFDEERIALPLPMGPDSGVVAKRGQREHVLRFLECNLDLLHEILGPPGDAKLWPIHVKNNIGVLNFEALVQMAETTELKDFIPILRSWIYSSEHYNINWRPIAPDDVPISKLTPAAVEVLLKAGKIEPHEGEILADVRCWLLKELRKKRLRPIAVPSINRSLDQSAMLRVRNQTRLERRASMIGKKFVIEFDLEAAYDQVHLGAGVRNCFVLRVRDHEGKDKLYHLTRLPMGVCFAVGVMQYITWVLTEPIAEYCSTTIDNIRIAAESEADFCRVVRIFLHRVDVLNLTINEHQKWRSMSDEDLARAGSENAKNPFPHIGECYVGESIRCLPKHVEALSNALQFARERNHIVTRRWFAGFMGLLAWMSHILEISLSDRFHLMRMYSRMMSTSTSNYGQVDWDGPFHLSAQIWDEMIRSSEPLLVNAGVPLRPLLAPGPTNAAYDTIIVCDACETGFGAYVRLHDGSIWLLRRGWRNASWRYSAHTEPWGIIEAVKWAKSKGNVGHLAVITDHRAIPLGQRRWYDGFRGFSAAFPLNACYQELYSDCPPGTFRRDVFFVEGSQNIADAPSRSVSMGSPFTAEQVNIVFPDVSDFYHPHAARAPREPWMV